MTQGHASGQEPPTVGPAVIRGVVLVDRFERPPGFTFENSSLPGHLIQLIRAGVVTHDIGGRHYILSPGDVIWYHEDERVIGEVLEGPWSLSTVSFIAPTLPPPPFDCRVRRADPAAHRHFDNLLTAWRDLDQDPLVRELRVQAQLLELIADVEDAVGLPYRMDATARLWWELEGEFRRDLAQPVTLKRMSAISDRSAATIARACHEATGTSPLKRIKQIRMSLARGLVQHSQLSMTDIANRIGYSRVHEFSRDYHYHFGTTPTNDRTTTE